MFSTNGILFNHEPSGAVARIKGGVQKTLCLAISSRRGRYHVEGMWLMLQARISG